MEALRLRVDLDKAILDFEIGNIKLRLEKLGYKKVNCIDVPKFKSLTLQVNVNNIWFYTEMENIYRVLRGNDPIDYVLKNDIKEEKELGLMELRELSFNNYRSNLEQIGNVKKQLDTIDVPDIVDITDRCVKKELPEPYSR